MKLLSTTNKILGVSVRVLFISGIFLLYSLAPRDVVAQASPADSLSVNKPLRIIFGGDVMQHMPQVNAATTADGYDYTECFSYVKPYLDSADIVIFNLETTLSETGPYSGYPQFRSPAELAEALKWCGVDAVTLANNHICDKGRTGIDRTIGILSDKGIEYTGVFADTSQYRRYNPLNIQKNGFTLSILNYTYGTNGMPIPHGKTVNLIDTTLIRRDIQGIDRNRTDIIVVIYHWGEEYSRRQNSSQAQLARWTSELGVDIIIGHHPHVIQPVEIYRADSSRTGTVTAYSLGNLVSNQRKRYTDGGMFLQVDIEKSDSTVIKVTPSYMLTWVYNPPENGKRKYYILPSPAADTLLAPGTTDYETYRTFLYDSRAMLDSISGLKPVVDYD